MSVTTAPPRAGTGLTIGERLRFAYRDHAGNESRRTVEPHRLVCTERRWYLVAWDTDPLACEPDALREMRCLLTMVAGETVQRSGG